VGDIRQTHLWFWLLNATLALVAVGALVIAISANNESINQKEIVEEASNHVVAKVAGIGQAAGTADEVQAEAKERSEADRQQIDKQVAEAVEEGEGEVQKLTRRVVDLEGETESLAKENGGLAKEVEAARSDKKELAGGQAELAEEVKELEGEVEDLHRQLARLEK
jgi:chromosome segregation ATPase